MTDAAGPRLASLDVFRGLTMAAMVIVNNPGDWNHVYPPLLHAEWHGWTPTDLIFPFFLFIVGVSSTLSRTTRGPWARVLRRALLLVALGLFLSGFPFFDVSTWRIPGVLQRIGLCYAAAALVVRTVPSVAGIWGVAAALVLGHWALLAFVPPSAGDLSPSGNLGAHVDRAVFGTHLWRRDWDPEGLLSTIPAVATTLLGAIAGYWIRGEAAPRARVAGLLMFGVAGLVLGAVWHPIFPINKSLWTGSYVAFSGGAAAIVFALCYWWTDAPHDAVARPVRDVLVVLGRNAITLFVLSGLVARLLGIIRVGGITLKSLIYTAAFAPLAEPRNASLLFALATLAVLYVLLHVMHRRRLYLSV